MNYIRRKTLSNFDKFQKLIYRRELNDGQAILKVGTSEKMNSNYENIQLLNLNQLRQVG